MERMKMRGKKRREKKGKREREMRRVWERDRWGSEWVRERGRLLKRERERETDVPKLYVYNECELSMPGWHILTHLHTNVDTNIQMHTQI